MTGSTNFDPRMRVGAPRKILEAAEMLGLKLLYGESLKPGDMYLAARNGPAQLLTVDYVHSGGWVKAREEAYSFDTFECIKVCEVRP